MSGKQHQSTLACVLSHVANFVVNVALVKSPWQHYTTSCFLQLPINAKHMAGQAIRTVFQVFSMT